MYKFTKLYKMLCICLVHDTFRQIILRYNESSDAKNYKLVAFWDLVYLSLVWMCMSVLFVELIILLSVVAIVHCVFISS